MFDWISQSAEMVQDTTYLVRTGQQPTSITVSDHYGAADKLRQAGIDVISTTRGWGGKNMVNVSDADAAQARDILGE